MTMKIITLRVNTYSPDSEAYLLCDYQSWYDFNVACEQ